MIKSILAILCYTVSIGLGGIGFCIVYLAASCAELGTLCQFGKAGMGSE